MDYFFRFQAASLSSSFRTESRSEAPLFYRHFERSPEAKRRDDVRNPTLFIAICLISWRGISHPPLVDVVTNRRRRIRNDGTLLSQLISHFLFHIFYFSFLFFSLIFLKINPHASRRSYRRRY